MADANIKTSSRRSSGEHKGDLSGENSPPRDPKLAEQDMMSTIEMKAMQHEADHSHESIASQPNMQPKSALAKGGQSRLDSAQSYTDIVNSDNAGGGSKGPGSGPSVDEAPDVPITATVISNVRGRSIIAGSKEVYVNVNGSRQIDEMGAAIQTDGTEQSTHRISNERLNDFTAGSGVPARADDGPVMVSQNTTPMAPAHSIEGGTHAIYNDQPSQQSLLAHSGLNKDITSGLNISLHNRHSFEQQQQQ